MNLLAPDLDAEVTLLFTADGRELLTISKGEATPALVHRIAYALINAGVAFANQHGVPMRIEQGGGE